MRNQSYSSFKMTVRAKDTDTAAEAITDSSMETLLCQPIQFCPSRHWDGKDIRTSAASIKTIQKEQIFIALPKLAKTYR